MNIPEPPDLYALELVRLVAKHRGFTAASKEAGLSQSALTRQIQNVEKKLGLKVFDRTTRTLSLTEPGAVLLRETAAIPGILKGALRRLGQDYLAAPKQIRIGISPFLAQSHYPGLFFGKSKLGSEVRVIVRQLPEPSILSELIEGNLDLGILVQPPQLPSAVTAVHRMIDRFCIISPIGSPMPPAEEELATWVGEQSWLLPTAGSVSREIINKWAMEGGLSLNPGMELENFDLMTQFVGLGMGSALVPRRCLSGLRRNDLSVRKKLSQPLDRTLIAVTPTFGIVPAHVDCFVKSILFS